MNPNFETAKEQFLAGLACQQAGAPADAELHYRRALAALPGRASTLTNLGATLVQLGRPAEALPYLEQAALAAPAELQAWSHRGLALVALRRDDEAMACFEHVATVSGTVTEQAAAWFEHARCLARLERPDAALVSCDSAIAAGPDIAAGWALRGSLLKDLGRQREAAAALRRAIELGADTALNRYLLASLEGRDAPPQPPPGYVEGLFDAYAAAFDTHLVQTLHYDAPELLARAIAGLSRRFTSALDLGCGTGLCGPLLRPYLHPRDGRLEGVDLSSAMLGLARERGVYDTLAQGDIIEFMQHTEQRFDLVVAADVFIYIGDLDPVWAAVRRVLQPGGCFCFSAERAADPLPFELRPSSRYAHSEAALRALSRRHGLLVKSLQHAAIRLDQGVPVAGLFFMLTAPD